MSVGAGYAGDHYITPFNNSTDVIIGDVVFSIPEGFGNYSDDNATNSIPNKGSEQHYGFYMSEDGGKIHIYVIKDFLGMSLDDVWEDGANKTTIGGKEGWSFNKNDLHYFSYVNDDNGIYIGVTNQSRLVDLVR